MASGSCVGWQENRGFGFIRSDEGGADVFVHRNDIMNAIALAQGWRVTFDIGTDERRGKPKAVRVRGALMPVTKLH
jgi:cold shock protein